jgi:hypothetical protein
LLKKKTITESLLRFKFKLGNFGDKKQWFLSELIRILNAAVLRIDAPVGGGRIL